MRVSSQSLKLGVAFVAVVVLGLCVVSASSAAVAVSQRGVEASELVASAWGAPAAAAWHDWEGSWQSSIEFNRWSPAGGWGAPERIVDPANAQNGHPTVAVGPRGETLIAWEGGCQNLMFSSAAPESPASVPLNVHHDPTQCGGVEPHMGVDEAGDATIVWHTGEGWRYIDRRATGAFGAVQVLSTETEREWPEMVEWPGLAVARNGDAVFAGKGRTRGGVYVWTRLAGHAFGHLQVLEEGMEVGYPVSIAIGPHGEAIVAWSGRSEPYATHPAWVAVALRAPGATSFGTPKRLAYLPDEETVSAGVDRFGDMGVVYEGSNVEYANGPHPMVITRHAGGEWGHAEELGPTQADKEPLPQIAYDEEGDAYVGWTNGTWLREPPYESTEGVFVAERPREGSFSPGARISDAPAVNETALAGTTNAGVSAWLRSAPGETFVEGSDPRQGAIDGREVPEVAPAGPGARGPTTMQQAGAPGSTWHATTSSGASRAPVPACSAANLRDALTQLLRSLILPRAGHAHRARASFAAPCAGMLRLALFGPRAKASRPRPALAQAALLTTGAGVRRFSFEAHGRMPARGHVLARATFLPSHGEPRDTVVAYR